MTSHQSVCASWPICRTGQSERAGVPRVHQSGIRRVDGPGDRWQRIAIGLSLSGGLDTRVMLSALDRRAVPLDVHARRPRLRRRGHRRRAVADGAHQAPVHGARRSVSRRSPADGRSDGVADRRHVRQPRLHRNARAEGVRGVGYDGAASRPCRRARQGQHRVAAPHRRAHPRDAIDRGVRSLHAVAADARQPRRCGARGVHRFVDRSARRAPDARQSLEQFGRRRPSCALPICAAICT